MSVKVAKPVLEKTFEPTTEIARVIGAVASGDFSRSIAVNAKGEILE
ncbi:hypothetical protein [Leptospira alexanderi]|nr:hypothetical protein [Leptospira alexanderi]